MTSTSREKFGLVIPTLNEAGNISTLLDRLSKAVSEINLDCEFIVVDDDSTDGTPGVVLKCAERDSRIRLIVRKGQKGLAGAVIHGWQNTDASLLGVIDADLQHPPEVLPELLQQVVTGADIAIASRYASGKGDGLDDWSKLRRLISHFGILVTAPLQRKNLKLKDPLSGFFVVRRSCIEGLDLQPEGFKILLEILVKGRIAKAVEVPFRFATRHSGRSKANLKVAIHYFSLLGKLSRYAIFGSAARRR